MNVDVAWRPAVMGAVVCLVLMSVVCPAHAGMTLTWDECVRKVLADNPDIRGARESLRAAEADWKSSRATYLPDISASGSYSRTHAPRTGDNFSYGVSGSQRLYPGLDDRPEVEQSAAQLDAARAGLASTVASVRYSLKSAFADMLFAQENIRLTEKIADRREQNVRLVKARFDAGREHKGSYLRLQAAAHQARFEVQQARRALRVAQRKLLQMLGQEKFSDVGVRGSLETDTPPSNPDIEMLSEQVPAVIEATANRRAAEAGLTVTRRRFGPTVSASASASRSSGKWLPRIESGEWTGGISISLPLYSGTSEKYDVISAEAGVIRLQSSEKNAKDQAVYDLEDKLASLSDAIGQVAVQDDFLEAAKVRAQIGQAQYTSGLLSFEDWDIIENDLIDKQKSSLAGRRTALIAESAWQETLGTGF